MTVKLLIQCHNSIWTLPPELHYCYHSTSVSPCKSLSLVEMTSESLILILIPNRITHVAWISVCVCILTSTGELQLQQRCLDSGSLPLASTKRPTARHVVNVFVCKQDKRHLLLLSCHLPPSSHQPPPDQPMGMGLMANVRKTDSQGVPGAAITMSLHTHMYIALVHTVHTNTQKRALSLFTYIFTTSSKCTQI